jgi:hypothetical protein
MSEEYSGPEVNETYSNENAPLETFDDLDDWQEPEVNSEEDDEEDLGVIAPKKSKKEEEKNKLGRKGDDLDIVDNAEDEGTPPAPKPDEDEDDEKEEKKKEEEKPKSDEEKAAEKSKGKKAYLKIGEETFGISTDALVPVIIDGKKVEVPLQELRNEYSGKQYAQKQLDVVNQEKQRLQSTQKTLQEQVSKYQSVAQKINDIASDVDQNPKEAFKIFLDAFGFDTYDLEERMMKHDLHELSSLLQMSDVERKAYLLEKKNSHLQSQAEKRKQLEAESVQANTYRQKVDSLRKSFGVSEAQYVDAYEELLGKGYKEDQISESNIVEWAATKPHRPAVTELLKPYEDDFSDDVYGELAWTLAMYLAKGEATKETLQKHLQDVYGVPTIVKDLNEKFNPVGRKSSQKAAPPSAKKHAYESFDDFEED